MFFVEGIDDCWFLGSIFSEMELDPTRVLIISVGGQDNFAEYFQLFRKHSKYKNGTIKSIAILCDADDSFSGKTNRMNAIFSSVSWPKMTHAKPIPGVRKFGLFIFPEDGQDGDLEHLCLQTVIETDIGELSSDTINRAQQIHGLSLNNLSKRQSQTYLAISSGNLCRGVGRGFADGRFNRNHEKLKPIRIFISEMVN
ncbi:DUF3226 domain-containing protein [Acidiphilium sp. PM]|uniref:DUF3226 domain-containing protein n=1 Tax=Acidiphilium sp. PM TaxID=1043206 RepID=UPI0035290077